MKKIASLLAFMLILNGCDDGNLTQEDIDFEDFTTQSCSTNNIIYKINDKEALLIEIPPTSFGTEPTTTSLTIGTTTNRVIYRFYDGAVSSDNFCETIQPATPIVLDQWTATSGTIKIVTTAIAPPSTDGNNSTKITGYNHLITLTDITFSIKNGEQTFRTLPFGNYVKTITPLQLNFEKLLTKCSDSNILYEFKKDEAIMLNIDPALIVNEVTATNSPRTGLIGSTTNTLTYRLFSGLLSSSYFCNTTTPTTPTLSQEWTGLAGVSGTSGIIEVTTTTNGPNAFKHTITLKKATLKKGNNSFTLGDSYILGELNTTN
ncbi:hypothetical protein SLW70_10035 [Flavobacterium sp. NG2]|uniref:hypothetical protein n=1 Tax=Flavobacterium sp. NG2 TaxID=3097547 RepID=UPI002A83642D|nr:hypothetical protein [Flavobacterium sp. NG2]WPR70284.1 hypothetical protein SLW70_10035 [Flavobacterium sp. NG2]